MGPGSDHFDQENAFQSNLVGLQKQHPDKSREPVNSKTAMTEVREVRVNMLCVMCRVWTIITSKYLSLSMLYLTSIVYNAVFN